MAKTPRAPTSGKGKGKAGVKIADKGKDGEGNIVYDYHEASVHNLALRAQVLQGYEEFKVRVSLRSLLRPPLCTLARRFMTFFFHHIAYSWIVHVCPWLTGTAGAGTTAGEVLHGVGVEVGYPNIFGIW